MIGKLVSHYRILEKLGEGGMGVVYKAEDMKLDRFVALKFLPSHLGADEEEKKRFIHEAKTASALDHPNICTIHEIDETEDGQIFICMAYYEGKTLKKKTERGPLKVDEALDIAVQIAQGLTKAHERGIVHRDIKPANVLTTQDGVAKIVDFGLAKLAGRTKLTKTGTTMGTVAYMSPEQARGEEVDHRSDIWSVGVVLYEMLTGQLPFKGEYEQAVVYSIMNEEPEPITGLRTGVSVELERIVNKCLEKDAAERYQTAGDFAADLRHVQRIMAAQTPSPRPAPSPKVAGPRARRWSWVAGLAVGAALALAIFFRFFAPNERETISPRKMLAVLPFENLGSSEDEYFAAGMTEEITSRLASVSGLGVISRTSTVQYAETNKTIKQIGEELGVDYVLEGTVRWDRAPDGPHRVRITPQLIRVSDDIHLWAQAYDRVIEDIFKVQSEIAQKVVEQLGVTLLEPERRSVGVKPTKNLEAYQAYLRGRYYEGRPHFTLRNWKQVVQSYQRAVELDPGFALAWAELSKAHSRLYFFRHDLSDERLQMAKHAAEQALELAPESPRVHLVLSYYYLWASRDSEQALKKLEIAEKGLPNNAEILQAKAYIFELKGRFEEAQTAFEKAFELSPRDASFPTELMFIFWFTRNYPQAVEAANQAIALAPNEIWPYLGKTFVYWSWKGATEEARAALGDVPIEYSWATWAWFWQEMFEGRYRQALARLSSTSDDWIRLKMWARPKSLYAAYAYELLNKPQLARKAYQNARSLLETEIKQWPQDPRLHSSLGITYAALGRKEEAIREGKKAVELLPVSKDAFYGLPYVQDLAHIYTLVGEYDAAIDQIEYLLSIPSWFSVSWLQIDPRCNPLRDHSRFQQLLEKYSRDRR